MQTKLNLLPEFPSQIKGLKIGHLNIRSLPLHLDELRLILQEHPFDIFSINESRLDSSISKGEVKINGYSIIRKDRNREGGGVAIFVKENLTYSKVDLPDFSDLELVCILISQPFSKQILISSWYRPPDSPVVVLSRFENFLRFIDSKETESIILTDSNCDLLKPDSQAGALSFYYDAYQYTQLIKKPTRITEDCETLIDHIATTNSEMIVAKGVCNLTISE